MPNYPTSGPLLSVILQHIDRINFTEKDVSKPEYVHRLGEVTQIAYAELNVSSKFHQGTSSNVAVIDMSDNYVSVVT